MNEQYLYALVSTYAPQHVSSLTQLAGGLFIKEVRDGCTYANGVLHSFNDRPAEITPNGTQLWYRMGQLHRTNDDFPAVIQANGSQFWWQDGLRHRDHDRPALIFANGLREWWRNGQRYLRYLPENN